MKEAHSFTNSPHHKIGHEKAKVEEIQSQAKLQWDPRVKWSLIPSGNGFVQARFEK